MKKIPVCFLSTLLFLIFNGFCQFEINIPFFSHPPAIDGNLNESCWQKAYVFDVVKSVEGDLLKDRWKVFLGCDTEAIYTGIEAEVSEPDRILKMINTRDAKVWKDDCFEIMVDYKNEGKEYIHLLINTQSVKCDLKFSPDARIADPKNFDNDWPAICQVKGNKIFVEFKIPYAMFDLFGKKDNDFRINICRENKIQGEYSSITGTFQEIDKFFTLKNLPIPDVLKKVNLYDINWATYFGENILTVKLTNASDKKITCKIEMMDRNGSLTDIETVQSVKPKETLEIKKKYFIGEPTGDREIVLRLIDAKTGDLIKTIGKVFSLQPEISVYTDKYLYDETDREMAVKVKLNLLPEILKESQLKIYLKKDGKKNLLWQKKGLDSEVVAIINLKDMPFGIKTIVAEIEYRKTKNEMSVPFRKGKSPFYREEL